MRNTGRPSSATRGKNSMEGTTRLLDTGLGSCESHTKLDFLLMLMLTNIPIVMVQYFECRII